MSAIDTTLTIILSVNSDTHLYPLTRERAKSAVPFGGNYRIIDFPLANCLRSGLRRVLILTQYKSHSLQKHLRDGWSIYNQELGEFITPVSPQMRTGRYGYTGATDAMQQSLYLLERNEADYICVLSGDHIYRMDYAAMLDFHVDTQADVTIACVEFEDLINKVSQCRVRVQGGQEVTKFEPASAQTPRVPEARGERPPPSPSPLLRGREGAGVGSEARGEGLGRDPFLGSEEGVSVLASMEVYVFSKGLLIQALQHGNYAEGCSHDLGEDLIPRLLEAQKKIMAYRFGGEAGRVTQDRYWRNLETLDEYYEANMDLLRHEPPIDLYQHDWPIRTYQAQHPPARTVPGKSCNEGVFVNSIVASGTVIAGGGVNHSLLFPRVFIEDGATVEDSILLSGVEVGEGARLLQCIVDKNVWIPPGESIGYDRARDVARFTVTEKGVVVVPKGYRFE